MPRSSSAPYTLTSAGSSGPRQISSTATRAVRSSFVTAITVPTNTTSACSRCSPIGGNSAHEAATTLGVSRVPSPRVIAAAARRVRIGGSDVLGPLRGSGSGVMYRLPLTPLAPLDRRRPREADQEDSTPMARIVRAALLQAEWTGEKESMIEKHEKYAREAAAQGAKVMCFQELFYGPYFCQVQDPQYFSYTEHIPNGPTTKRMQELAKETGMVLIVPMYEEDEQTTGIYYNTAAVIDADGTYLGKYRKTHIPHVKGFWEKYYFRPGNTGYPVFDTAVGKVGVYICYDRHFPEGARALGLNGAELVFIPSATSRGLSEYLWRVEQVSHALANGYFVGTINRVGIEKEYGDDDFYGQSYFCDPRGQFIGELGSAHDEELIVRDMDLDKVQEVRQTWQFYRDRRPEAYADLVAP